MKIKRKNNKALKNWKEAFQSKSREKRTLCMANIFTYPQIPLRKV